MRHRSGFKLCGGTTRAAAGFLAESAQTEAGDRQLKNILTQSTEASGRARGSPLKFPQASAGLAPATRRRSRAARSEGRRRRAVISRRREAEKRRGSLRGWGERGGFVKILVGFKRVFMGLRGGQPAPRETLRNAFVSPAGTPGGLGGCDWSSASSW